MFMLAEQTLGLADVLDKFSRSAMSLLRRCLKRRLSRLLSRVSISKQITVASLDTYMSDQAESAQKSVILRKSIKHQ